MVSWSNTRIVPMSALVRPPARQIIGSSHFGSAPLARPMSMRNQAPSPSACLPPRRSGGPGIVAILWRRTSARRGALGVDRPRPGLARALAGVGDVLDCRQARAIEPHQRRGYVLGAALGEQAARHFQIFLGSGLGQRRIGDEALGVERAHFGGGRRPDPDGFDARLREQPLGAAAAPERRQNGADALPAGAAGAPAPMLKRLDVVGQIGVNDDADIGQIDAPRGDVGRHQHARAAVAQRLHRLIALMLAQFARKRHGGKAALGRAWR